MRQFVPNEKGDFVECEIGQKREGLSSLRKKNDIYLSNYCLQFTQIPRALSKLTGSWCFVEEVEVAEVKNCVGFLDG